MGGVENGKTAADTSSDTFFIDKTSNQSANDKREGDVFGIPMPKQDGFVSSSDAKLQSSAWQKAQAALKKVTSGGATAGGTSNPPPTGPYFGASHQQNPADFEAAMMHYYPWFFSTPNFGYKMPSYVQQGGPPGGPSPAPPYASPLQPPPPPPPSGGGGQHVQGGYASGSSFAASSVGCFFNQPTRPQQQQQQTPSFSTSDVSPQLNSFRGLRFSSPARPGVPLPSSVGVSPPSRADRSLLSPPASSNPQSGFSQSPFYAARPPKGGANSNYYRGGPGGGMNPNPQFPRIRFNFRQAAPTATNAISSMQSAGGNALQRGAISETVRKYVERAYEAVGKDERDKVEEYLKKKLNPLLASGAAKAVDWDKEPLPSEVNFEIKTEWTPASELRKATAAGAGSGTVAPPAGMRSPPMTGGGVPWPKGRSRHNNERNTRTSRSPRRHDKKRRLSPDIRCVSSERSSSESEVRIVKVHSRNKQMASKRTSGGKKNRKKGGGAVDKGRRWLADAGSEARREERARRFARDDAEKRHTRQNAMRRRLLCEGVARCEDDDTSIVGTSTDIEKPYFRLTAAPDPSTVRPVDVLERALKHVQRKYVASKNKDYLFVNDQLKSIRQDLMVQRIRTDFTVTVYETHARIALENADREEFSQCQSQLMLLYKEVPNSPNQHEFLAYRLLYYMAIMNTIDQKALMAEITAKARQDVCVAFSLKVREAWALNNYVRLCRLYRKAPRMASYVMDFFIERERKAALNAALKSYRPSIPVSALATNLALSEQKLCEWLAGLGIAAEPGGVVDCRTHCNTLATAAAAGSTESR